MCRHVPYPEWAFVDAHLKRRMFRNGTEKSERSKVEETTTTFNIFCIQGTTCSKWCSTPTATTADNDHIHLELNCKYPRSTWDYLRLSCQLYSVAGVRSLESIPIGLEMAIFGIGSNVELGAGFGRVPSRRATSHQILRLQVRQHTMWSTNQTTFFAMETNLHLR